MDEIKDELEPVKEAERSSAAHVVGDDQLVEMLVDRARSEGLQLTGEGGLLQQLTKRVLESALDGEITDHLGYDKHDPAGKNSGNSRNGNRSKTVLTDVGPVEVSVPRDVAGTFEPQIVKKRQRRLSGVDEMVLSLSAKGLTHGEISAHLAEIYGAQVSKTTITTITDKVMEGMADWQNRPLDHRRWEIETAYLELKSSILGGRILRARTPTGIEQEVYALLLVYHLLRTAMADATSTRDDVDPTGPVYHRLRPPATNSSRQQASSQTPSSIWSARSAAMSWPTCCPPDGYACVHASSNAPSPNPGTRPHRPHQLQGHREHRHPHPSRPLKPPQPPNFTALGLARRISGRAC